MYQKYKAGEYNIVEQSGEIIQYLLFDNQYLINDVYKNDDEYVSTVFTDLKISLRDIFRLEAPVVRKKFPYYWGLIALYNRTSVPYTISSSKSIGSVIVDSLLKRIIFHIDVNSAYLSWTAVRQLETGKNTVDIREISSIIGGSSENRHGIVLAKSIPAKKYNIQTGEPIVDALKKCPDLAIFPPDYKLYVRCSNAMVELLNNYSPTIQRYSIDEVFMDASHFKEEYLIKAHEIKKRISEELGFNVNIGISHNKLLAKMASDFSQKNTVHTLFPEEVESKMWHLPVRDLFMVGRATEQKLSKLNIKTIGELAKYDINILKPIFKSYAYVIHNYANGIDESEVRIKNYVEVKGIGNSTTISRDITKREDALKILLSLVETCSMRLRANGSMCGVITVSIKTNEFFRYSHQRTLDNVTDSTEDIFNAATKIFDDDWKGEAVRQLGIRLTKLCSNEFYQRTLFDDERIDKKRALDKTIDGIRAKYGDKSIVRSTFVHSGFDAFSGGNGEDEYPMMGSVL